MAAASRIRWGLATVLLVTIGIVWLRRPKPVPPLLAYVGDREATLWSTTAQVRQAVATLGYGEKVLILRRSGDLAQVSTEDGAKGWVDAAELMDAALWQKAADVLAHASSLSTQAAGHTRTISNVHLDPGRDSPRIFQFGRNVPVLVLERKVMDVPATPSAEGAPAEDPSTAGGEKPKQEDWLLVTRAETPAGGNAAATTAASAVSASHPEAASGRDIPIAGWVLARFIELDPPTPIPDYASASGLRVVAWAELNRVPEGADGKPQYLLAGIRGGEGQPCDFTSLRVFTWGAARQQYETAFVESELCGALPIRVQQTPAGPDFRFPDLDDNRRERLYRMRQTSVERVRTDAPAKGKKS